MNRPLAPTRAETNLAKYHVESAAAHAEDRAMLRALWPYLKPHKNWLAAGLFSIAVGALLTLARPLVMMHAVDEGVKTRDPKVMIWGGAALLGLAIVEQLINFAQVYAVQILGARSLADLRRRTFEKLNELPLAFFDRQPVGRLVTRVTNDVDAIQELFNSGALNALGDVISLVGIVAIMVTLDLHLSASAFASLPAIALLLYWVRGRARDAFRSIRAETARMNSNMSEQVSGVGVIQAFGREDAKAVEFDEINAAYRDANMRSIKYDAIQDAAIDAVSAIATASLIVSLGFSHASFGTVVALSAYLTQFFMPISLLAQRYTLLQSALSGAERVFELLGNQEQDAPQLDLGSDGSQAFALELEKVSFGYKPEQDVLHEVDLQVRPGESIALVGPTGCGKTTITSLLLRLYDTRRGTIRLHGKDTRTLSRSELRRNFSVVPQEMFLFEGTLAQNIAAGEVPDMAKITRVLADMGAEDWFRERPGGLDAHVQQGGTNFSVGERQLIAFARALYRDAPIIVLDEATANIDSTTEARMQKAMAALLKGRTAIVVAHRLSTIRSVDRIVVLQKGRVTEQGTHDQLLAQGGLYATLHRLHLSRH
jgi:ATP-binding cassette, subfamily B, multidrug efflux pump